MSRYYDNQRWSTQMLLTPSCAHKGSRDPDLWPATQITHVLFSTQALWRHQKGAFNLPSFLSGQGLTVQLRLTVDSGSSCIPRIMSTINHIPGWPQLSLFYSKVHRLKIRTSFHGASFRTARATQLDRWMGGREGGREERRKKGRREKSVLMQFKISSSPHTSYNTYRDLYIPPPLASNTLKYTFYLNQTIS